ncbi:hypothetical protein [Streptomyces sp. NPDC004286]|uniref:hypothetical protein n=1 Tax=Streptomyces sp. NPDC004286 TaxID=3364696 RepID=UPI0036A34CB5
MIGDIGVSGRPDNARTAGGGRKDSATVTVTLRDTLADSMGAGVLLWIVGVAGFVGAVAGVVAVIVLHRKRP